MIESLLKQLKYNNSAELLNHIAVEYYCIGEYDKSLSYYTRAHSNAKNDRIKETILSNIGLVYYTLGQYEKAIKYFNTSKSTESGSTLAC